MISEAYGQPCTCYDAVAGDILPCPQHGMVRAWPRSPEAQGRQIGDGPGMPWPAMPAPEAHSHEYDRGFRAGIEAAIKMMSRTPGE